MVVDACIKLPLIPSPKVHSYEAHLTMICILATQEVQFSSTGHPHIVEIEFKHFKLPDRGRALNLHNTIIL